MECEVTVNLDMTKSRPWSRIDKRPFRSPTLPKDVRLKVLERSLPYDHCTKVLLIDRDHISGCAVLPARHMERCFPHDDCLKVSGERVENESGKIFYTREVPTHSMLH
jgi:hypothetical protein